MEITELVWLEVVVEKIESKHHVTQIEVEEVLTGNVSIGKMRRGRFQGEHVYRALGQTEGKRYLAVFFIYKQTDAALILSAREMDKKERKSYAKK